jgi:MoaA/NifB/PqqE/SkfB family radical SAM enzyme
MDLSILYRGPLSSCNYGCEYCPFAKRRETRDELAVDERALGRFVEWVGRQGAAGHAISVLFTPWGEALVRPWYQEALVRLTNLPHVRRAAVQTNVSCRLEWAERCDKAKLGLWCTYHPSETTRERFVGKCREMDARRLRYSVGIVGLKGHVVEAEALRRELRPDVYVWVNAYKRADEYYVAEDLGRLTAVDPLFPVNNVRHPSRGMQCRAGDTVFSVDGDGTMRRCHFIKAAIGNLYEAGWENALRPAACTNETCGCHIGHVHMQSLGLYEVFGEGVLERIPSHVPPPSQPPATRTSVESPTDFRRFGLTVLR